MVNHKPSRNKWYHRCDGWLLLRESDAHGFECNDDHVLDFIFLELLLACGILWRMPTTHCPCSLSSRSYLSSWHLPRVWLQTSQSHARMRKSNLPSLPMPLVRLLGASTHATCSLHSRSSGHQCHQSLCRQGAYTQIVEGVLAPWSTSQWRLENFWSKERSAKESGRQ